jgi:hypothetical protein
MVCFHLREGSRIISYAGHRRRVERGYEAEGTMIRNMGSPRPFAGLIADGRFNEFSVERFGLTGTVAVLGIDGCAVAFV